MPNFEGYNIQICSTFDGTSIVFPDLKIVFGMGSPLPALHEKEELLITISHMHPDYICGLFKYVRYLEEEGKPAPTVIVPREIKGRIIKMLEALREDSDAAYTITIVDLAIGEDFQLGENHFLRPFRTSNTHGQGYIVYSIENKLKQEYAMLPESDLKRLESSGVETTYAVALPEIAFAGRTNSEFFDYPENTDVFRSKILLLECMYPSYMETIEKTRSRGGIHMSEIVNRQQRFENVALLFYSWSDSCDDEDIKAGLSELPPNLVERAHALH